ncbi:MULTISPECIES: helix-turn-helix domain-containing protein [Rhizobium/Agrobacterium group]|uniref:HTH cro/C1-type domain-containing protein n=1 Tax=Allorhizobium ampelinum (strain ATCC BAA-846 / DSM 112012 / S4) TaxID=311402 RepID=B9K2R1_ALLAM|nr:MULTISPECIES: helix-turn-helix transcriptional regulator [Rhizobium/Agrobacterium group]ACM39159.1 hypothetical protein Avi_6166 [Allorhizobium ampelinum S4]MUO30805.1 helix-turn-helix domain-containing protein [Agrobacterium vitis]
MSNDIDVKAIRADLKMTQAEFASEVGVSQSMVSQWETGTAKPRGSATILIGQLRERHSPKEAAQ